MYQQDTENVDKILFILLHGLYNIIHFYLFLGINQPAIQATNNICSMWRGWQLNNVKNMKVTEKISNCLYVYLEFYRCSAQNAINVKGIISIGRHRMQLSKLEISVEQSLINTVLIIVKPITIVYMICFIFNALHSPIMQSQAINIIREICGYLQQLVFIQQTGNSSRILTYKPTCQKQYPYTFSLQKSAILQQQSQTQAIMKNEQKQDRMKKKSDHMLHSLIYKNIPNIAILATVVFIIAEANLILNMVRMIVMKEVTDKLKKQAWATQLTQSIGDDANVVNKQPIPLLWEAIATNILFIQLQIYMRLIQQQEKEV